MSKILRVGFAMGGGVSLGTFCGTALSQALKLLIVYGRDRGGDPFDRVEVDVFSGASAGSLSLAAMLPALAAPDTAAFDDVLADLRTEFPGAIDALRPPQLDDLCAAELMQRLQRQLWSKEITLKRLLAEDTDHDLAHLPSLLDRGAVDDIARDFIVDHDYSAGFGRRRLLADRVLFACTLTNLTPIIWDATRNFPGKDVGFIGLNDGLRSATHRDLRVFDLNFEPVGDPDASLYPAAWCLYHPDAATPGLIGDLRARAAWARIAATAVASGAFPVAFEPVVLPRGGFEYGEDRWNQIKNRPPHTPIPPGDSHPFTYVDGGVLNNEPIREAFRLASFIDGHTRAKHPEAQFERLIVFVDPNVSDARPSFRVPGHARWEPVEPGTLAVRDAPAAKLAPSLPRLFAHVSSLVGAVLDESTGIEADKINAVHNQFTERDGIRQTLFETLTDEPRNDDLLNLMDYIETRLGFDVKNNTTPASPMTLPAELERVRSEELQTTAESPFAALKISAEEFAAQMRATGKVADKRLWLRLLAFVAVDLILRLDGKQLDAQLVAIAPFRNLTPAAPNAQPEPIWLPGGALFAFAGFMSDLPDELEHAAAKYCAAEFLRACDRIDAAAPLRPDPKTFVLEGAARATFEKALAADIDAGMDKLGRRVAAMLNDAFLAGLPPGAHGIVTALVTWLLTRGARKIDWRGKQEQACTFRIRVPDENYELDGDSLRDIDGRPVRNPDSGEWELIALATWNWKTESWSGDYVKRNQLDVDLDRGLGTDKNFCDLKLPDAAMMREQEFLPTPTFFVDAEKLDRTSNPITERAWQPQPGVVALEDRLVARKDAQGQWIKPALAAIAGQQAPAGAPTPAANGS